MSTYLFRVARSDGGAAREFSVELDHRMTVLDGLFEIQRKLDPSLSFRCSCRVGMCGSCAVRVNYEPRLACQTRVEKLKSAVINVAPLSHYPVLKDLVVDMTPFFDQWKRARPSLHPAVKGTKKLAIVPPDSEFGRHAAHKRDCITCGACYAACSVVGSNQDYLGPAAINKAALRLLDPRDSLVADRLQAVNSETGVWRCHAQFNCVAACPKGIPLTDSIMYLKRNMARPGKFNDKLSDPHTAR
jgi:succinate dehydrogenase / fumarate reductase iron-sulfur subunit